MNIYQVFTLGHNSSPVIFGNDYLVAMQTISVAFQWKHIYPEDTVILYGDGPFLSTVNVIKHYYNIQLPYSEFREVDMKDIEGTEYTGARWYTVKSIIQPGILLDPDILIFPEYTENLDFFRSQMEKGKIFLAGYEQGYHKPDIDSEIQTMLGLETDVNGNMNSGFMLIAGYYGEQLGRYEIELQKFSRSICSGEERMRTLEVIDGTGPKYWVRKQGIPYFSIDIPRLLHMTGLTMNMEVEHKILHGPLPKSKRIRYLAAHAIHSVQSMRGYSYREYCSLFTPIRVGDIGIDGEEVKKLVSGNQRFI